MSSPWLVPVQDNSQSSNTSQQPYNYGNYGDNSTWSSQQSYGYGNNSTWSNQQSYSYGNYGNNSSNYGSNSTWSSQQPYGNYSNYSTNSGNYGTNSGNYGTNSGTTSNYGSNSGNYGSNSGNYGKSSWSSQQSYGNSSTSGNQSYGYGNKSTGSNYGNKATGSNQQGYNFGKSSTSANQQSFNFGKTSTASNQQAAGAGYASTSTGTTQQAGNSGNASTAANKQAVSSGNTFTAASQQPVSSDNAPTAAKQQALSSGNAAATPFQQASTSTDKPASAADSTAPAGASSGATAGSANPPQDGEKKLSNKERKILYKQNFLALAQSERRTQILENQRGRRYDYLNHIRILTEALEEERAKEAAKIAATEGITLTPQDAIQAGETSYESVYGPGYQGRYPKKRKFQGCRMNNQLMAAEWLETLPDDFETDWMLVPCPAGKRCLVISTGGITTAYSKSGFSCGHFPSHLPGGNGKQWQKGKDFAILDCLYSEECRTYFILDMMCWKDTPIYGSEAEFRFYWLHTKIQECPEVTNKSKKNPYKFVPLPNYSCNRLNISNFMSTPLSFKLDGLLFYHKRTHYKFGNSPCVLWLKPWMVSEALGVAVPPHIMKTAPEGFRGYHEFIKEVHTNRNINKDLVTKGLAGVSKKKQKEKEEAAKKAAKEAEEKAKGEREEKGESEEGKDGTVKGPSTTEGPKGIKVVQFVPSSTNKPSGSEAMEVDPPQGK